MNVSRIFIERPIGTALLAIGLFLAGAVAYGLLPVASMPAIEFPTVRIIGDRPGADPTTMASSVASPLERRLGEIAGVTEMTSTSSLGSTSIAMQFDLNRNIDGAGRDVQAALNAATADLPSDLPQVPTFRKANPSASPILILALTSKTMTTSDIYDTADTIIGQRISQVEGVADVTVSGADQPATRIQIDPTLVASMGVSFEDVKNAVANANDLSPIGSVDGERQTIILQSNAQMTDPDEYKNIVVKNMPNGDIVKVGDVAKVIKATRNARSSARFGHDPAVLLIITKTPEANVIDTVDRREGAAAAAQGVDTGGHRHFDPLRPDDDDPRVGSRHAVHARLDDPARHVRRVRFSQALDADDRGRYYGAAFACGHMRCDVGGRVFDQQPDADGARRRRRLRRRRCDRDDRERLPQHGKGHEALCGGARGIAADRLHRHFDFGIAGRGIHSGSVHDRHRRPAAARVRADADIRHRHLGRRLADGDADDLRSLHQGRGRRASGTSPTEFSKAALALVVRAYAFTLRIALRNQLVMLAVFIATIVLTIHLYTVLPKGYLPEDDTGLIIAATEANADVSFAEMSKLQRAIARCDPCRSGGRQRRLVDRRGRRQSDAEPGPHVHQPEADRRARRRFDGGRDRPAARAARQDRRAGDAPDAVARYSRRCALGQGGLSIYALVAQRRRSL